ncbi:MAG: hypothetical protein DIU80_006315 [Chloroflexota bacterium]|nr:MAG: hypothetical protein DIU80_14975 [Chloroflexota bacterium]
MKHLFKNSGWNGLRGTVQRCDECRRSTIHLAAQGGVPVCSECGYSPAFAAFDDQPAQRIIRFPGRGKRA